MRLRFFHSVATVDVILINWALSAWSISCISDESALRGLPATVSLRDHDAWMGITATLQHLVRTENLTPTLMILWPCVVVVWGLLSAEDGLQCRLSRDLDSNNIQSSRQRGRARAKVKTDNRKHLLSVDGEKAWWANGSFISKQSASLLQNTILNVQVHIISCDFVISSESDGDTYCMWLNNFT